MIDRAARKIERERAKLDTQEKKHMREITKLAKAGQHVCPFSTQLKLTLTWYYFERFLLLFSLKETLILISKSIVSCQNFGQGHSKDEKSSKPVLLNVILAQSAFHVDVYYAILSNNCAITQRFSHCSHQAKWEYGHQVYSRCTKDIQ